MTNEIYDTLIGKHSKATQETLICENEEKAKQVAALISAKEQAETASLVMSKALKYNRGLIEASLDPLVTIGPDGIITDVNKATENVTGLPREKLIGTNFSAYFTEPDKAQAGYEKAFSEGVVFDYELALKHISGYTTPVLYNASVYRDDKGLIIGVFAAARDITATLKANKELTYLKNNLELLVKKRVEELVIANKELAYLKNNLELLVKKRVEELVIAEEALRSNERQLMDIIEFLPDATFAIDMTGHVILWNKAIERMTGIPASKMIGKGDDAYSIPYYGEARPVLVDLVFKSDEEIMVRYPNLTREGDALISEVYCPALYNNKGAWIFIKASPLHDQAGNMIGVIQSLRDITETKNTEEALRSKQRQLTDIIEFLPDATLAIDTTGHVILWNEANEKMTGIPASGMIGKGDYAYAIPYYGEAHPILLDLVFKNDEEIMTHYPNLTREGDALISEVYCPALYNNKGAWIFAKASSFHDQAGNMIGAIESHRDITEAKNAEEEKDKRAAELVIANQELTFQNAEKEERALELTKANNYLKMSLISFKKLTEAAIGAITIIGEKRDPYTAGHQQRVSKLACAIAKEMGWDESFIEGIRIAGLLHDIGKIAIPIEILSKPGKLSEDEFRLIKVHPKASYDILKDIEFSRPIADIVLQHHERLDGSGYPNGLKGDEICMDARILNVSDVVEAMSSYRPYRPALGLDKALIEIHEHKGTLYDEMVVDTCTRLFTSRIFEF
ncbi:HD domain-containing phosphohydrolase [Acetobacterium sp.]|uniref:HD domain-containing phosphohydrolase n=1 Tax=Acetobacterium sp. TaxID=1872094 RepID=UPI002F41FD3D